MKYSEIVINALKKPHASLSIKEIVSLTGMNSPHSAIYDLRQAGHSIIDVKCRNERTGRYYVRYMLGKRF